MGIPNGIDIPYSMLIPFGMSSSLLARAGHRQGNETIWVVNAEPEQGLPASLAGYEDGASFTVRLREECLGAAVFDDAAA